MTGAASNASANRGGIPPTVFSSLCTVFVEPDGIRRFFTSATATDEPTYSESFFSRQPHLEYVLLPSQHLHCFLTTQMFESLR